MSLVQRFDVIVVGGSYAGLSAAMALGRSLRRVLVIDSGRRCNQPTPHSHNFITHDGAKPGDIASLAKAQVLAYPTVRWLDGVATKGAKDGDGNFVITTEAGQACTSRKLIFATGVRDIMPKELVGFESCWGKSILHCPYCHGYEVRGQKTAVMLCGPRTMHLLSLVRNLTDDLTLLTNGAPLDLAPEQLEKLRKNNVAIVETTIREIEHDDGMMKAVVFSDGSSTPFAAMYAVPAFEQHCPVPAMLGCELTPAGHIVVDELMKKTTVPGILACGDCMTPLRAVAAAVAAGNMAGAVANMELAGEDF